MPADLSAQARVAASQKREGVVENPQPVKERLEPVAAVGQVLQVETSGYFASGSRGDRQGIAGSPQDVLQPVASPGIEPNVGKDQVCDLGQLILWERLEAGTGPLELRPLVRGCWQSEPLAGITESVVGICASEMFRQERQGASQSRHVRSTCHPGILADRRGIDTFRPLRLSWPRTGSPHSVDRLAARHAT
ncbi:hypothetical protein RB614_24365 [Phytohabitans sp. ZYX-F-186]|uniref:Uncharacterized protein n=1 Tax=Phytohabitans maris TaxID=3071409 RepID=A0ABU0ZKV9_9ACTN|nr:hypothetical protein [Phytohabitans sp. ZYX-F-186]MDQ7907660.1 hypothetical protein [Phytohabitans sp. ZYX-F-186]